MTENSFLDVLGSMSKMAFTPENKKRISDEEKIELKTDFNSFIINSQNIYGGQQHVFRFPNDKGASVVRHSGSYGNGDEWELAVLEFANDSNQFELTYDTEITDDVIGYLDDNAVNELLKRIKILKK